MELLFTDGKYSTEHHNSFEQPFFTGFIASTDKPHTKLIENETALSKVVFPEDLENLYRYIGNPYVEYYLSKWTIMSLKNVTKRFSIMRKNNQKRVIDFAFAYIGSGHIMVAAVDPIDGQIFYRYDGGSNGYERGDYWNFIQTYTPTNDHKVSFASFAKIATEDEISNTIDPINN